MANQLDADTLRLLDTTAEVDIETRRANGTPRRTTIWVVADGDAAYVRSVRGADGWWYRDLLQHPTATLHVGARALAARVQPAADAASIARVSDALRRKYERRWPHETDLMLQPHTLPTTLQLLPA